MSTQKDKTDEIDACTPEALADNSLPIVYLLASYYVDDKRKGKLEPIANTLVFADDPQTAQFDPLDPQLFATNSAGALYTVGNEDMCLRKPLHGHPNQERNFVLPPPEVVSFIQQAKIAEGKQNEWQKALIEEMKQFVPGENVQTLKLEAHPIANLRVPTDNDDDKAYKKWYKKLDPKKPILAYVMPKTRALMFMVNKELPIDFVKEINVSTPKHKLGELEKINWIDSDFGDFNLAVISGTRFTLPDGVYKIKIPLIESKMVFQKNRWSHILTTPDENGEYSYTLGEMARFDGEILDDYFRIPTPSAEDIEKYNNTIGGRIGIPKFAFDVHERVTNIMDLGTNTMALAKDGYSYVQDSLPSFACLPASAYR